MYKHIDWFVVVNILCQRKISNQLERIDVNSCEWIVTVGRFYEAGTFINVIKYDWFYMEI